MKIKIGLILIFLVAIFLRFYKLSEIPSGFHIDEVTVGYNAYSLMETGRDENNNFLPLYIDSFGDQRPAGYFYLTIPAIKIFGLNQFAVRFPSAFLGSLTVILVFFLAEEIFTNQLVALISSFLLAISPWHIIVTRATSESSFALFLIVFGTYLFFKAIKKNKYAYLFPVLIMYLISFYTYHTPRVFVPLLVLGVGLLCYPRIKERKTKKLILVFLVACLTIASLTFLIGPGQGRFKQVSIFNHPGVQLRLDEQIREEFPGTNVYLIRFFHNKIINYSREILSNYGKHFSFDFLFLNGGLPMRYKVPETGLLYLIELPFIFLGIIFLFKEKISLFWLPIYWLLLGPLAASLTQEDVPNIQRAFFMLPSFQILAAYGFYKILDSLKEKKLFRKIIISLSCLLLVFNFSYFLHQYLVHQRVYRPWYRNYGFKELITEINRLSPRYQKIVLTKAHNDPYIYILFYNQYNPKIYQKYRFLRPRDRWGFEKYIFHPSDCPSHVREEISQEGKSLFIDKGECKVMPYAQTLKIIFREDNTPAFRLLEVDKQMADSYFKQQEKLILKTGE